MVFDLYNTNDGCSRNCSLCWYRFSNLNYAFEYWDWRKNKENKDCGCMSRGKAQPGGSIPSKNKKSEFTSKYICICAKSVYVLDLILVLQIEMDGNRNALCIMLNVVIHHWQLRHIISLNLITRPVGFQYLHLSLNQGFVPYFLMIKSLANWQKTTNTNR